MTDMRDSLQSIQGDVTPSQGELERALADQLETDETIERHMSGKELVYEQEGEKREHGDNPLIVTTDHRVLLLAGKQRIDIPHAKIQEATLKRGFLRGSKLILTAWNGDSYRFKPSDGDLKEFVAYVDHMADSWQFVETLLDELHGRAQTAERHVEYGRADQAEAVIRDVEETFLELEERVEDTGLEETFDQQFREARQTLKHVQIQGQLAMGRKFLEKGNDQRSEDTHDYAAAHSHYREAREHLLAARSLAADSSIEMAEVNTELERVETNMEEVTVEPVERAQAAVERALETDNPERRVEEFETALSEFREALTFGWGTMIEPTTDREQLRFCIELTATGAIDAYREYAAECEKRASELATEGETDGAIEQYESALSELDTATDLAREFRAPDPELLEPDRDRIETKKTGLERWIALATEDDS